MKVSVEIPDKLGSYCLSSTLETECPFYAENVDDGSMYCRLKKETIYYTHSETKLPVKLDGCPAKK